MLRETTIGSVLNGEDGVEEVGRWIVNWSARMDAAVVGSEGERRVERKRRRA